MKNSITYEKAEQSDAEQIYRLCKQLIDDYENTDSIAYDKVLKWVRRKIESCLNEYTVIYADGRKAGYYRFYRKEDGEYELDDLYVFPEFQNRGIGSAVIRRCCASAETSVMLYVFIKNEKAVSLYQRLGFEIVQTVNDSRYILRRENQRHREADAE